MLIGIGSCFFSRNNTTSIEEDLKGFDCEIGDTNKIFVNKINIVAHRGANHLAPENTFAAGQKCVDANINFVEVDVRRSRDGIHYILHDPWVNRSTNGFGFINLMHSEKIDKLDAGKWFGASFEGEKVPRLSEYLSWAKGKIKVYLDVKDADMKELVEMVRKLEMQDQTFFWFSSNRKAKLFRQIAPELRLKINARNPAQVLKAKRDFDASIIECRLSDLSPQMVSACKENGVALMVLAKKNNLSEYCQLLQKASQIDLVNLDRPILFKKLREKIP